MRNRAFMASTPTRWMFNTGAVQKYQDMLSVPKSAVCRCVSKVSVKKVAARLTTKVPCRAAMPSEPVPMKGLESTERLS